MPAKILGHGAAGRKVQSIIARHHGGKRSLIPILMDIQDEERWLSPAALESVASALDLPLSHVYGVATFYKSLSLAPRGRHICTVCLGTACHVRGGGAVLEHFERKLGLRVGETSPDLEYTLERVNCLGACALAPLAVVDGRYYGQMNETKANEVLTSLTEPAAASPAEVTKEPAARRPSGARPKPAQRPRQAAGGKHRAPAKARRKAGK
jgi:NADH-quinone oxidoreductase subunit E